MIDRQTDRLIHMCCSTVCINWFHELGVFGLMLAACCSIAFIHNDFPSPRSRLALNSRVVGHFSSIPQAKEGLQARNMDVELKHPPTPMQCISNAFLTVPCSAEYYIIVYSNTLYL